jgi:hypothetical protein
MPMHVVGLMLSIRPAYLPILRTLLDADTFP